MTAQQFHEILSTSRAPLILDGALYTMLAPAGQSAESICLTSPDAVVSLHKQYIAAGADIITTNTFATTNPATMLRGVELARQAADPQTLVAASVGPLHPDTPFDDMVGHYHRILASASEADIIMLETATNLKAIRSALTAIQSAGIDTSIMISIAPGATPGTLLSGESYSDLADLAAGHPQVVTLGINCSSDRNLLNADLSLLASATPLLLTIHPNAGAPDARISPDHFAKAVADLWHKHPEIRIVGGCCGTSPAHISALQSYLRAD